MFCFTLMHSLLLSLTTATIIQAQFKGYYQRKKFVTMRLATIVIAKHWKRVLAKRLLEQRRKAAHRIRKYVNYMLSYFSLTCTFSLSSTYNVDAV